MGGGWLLLDINRGTRALPALRGRLLGSAGAFTVSDLALADGWIDLAVNGLLLLGGRLPDSIEFDGCDEIVCDVSFVGELLGHALARFRF